MFTGVLYIVKQDYTQIFPKYLYKHLFYLLNFSKILFQIAGAPKIVEIGPLMQGWISFTRASIYALVPKDSIIIGKFSFLDVQTWIKVQI